MKFEGTGKDDRAMRQRVLATLLEVDKAVQGRHVVEFEVVRTVNRKGYRHQRSFGEAEGPYNGDPKTLVKVVVEVPDDVRPSFRTLVADVARIEADGIRAAKEAKVGRKLKSTGWSGNSTSQTDLTIRPRRLIVG